MWSPKSKVQFFRDSTVYQQTVGKYLGSLLPCWTQAKQDLADSGTLLTITSVDVPALDKRVGDSQNVHFTAVQVNGTEISSLPYSVLAPIITGDNPFARAKELGLCRSLSSVRSTYYLGSPISVSK